MMVVRTTFLTSATREHESKPDILDVASLVQRALSGDSAAFESIILRYERRVVSLAMKLLGKGDDAQDAAQEVFLRTYKYLHRLNLEKSIEPWLMQMTVNVCRNIGRKRQRRLITFLESEAADAPTASTSGDPYMDVVEEQERQMLRKALNGLPEKERIAITLRDIEGLSTAEVAEILNSSESTVRSQVSRARVHMKEAIDAMMEGKR